MSEMGLKIAQGFKENIEEIAFVALVFLALVVILNYYNVDLQNTKQNQAY